MKKTDVLKYSALNDLKRLRMEERRIQDDVEAKIHNARRSTPSQVQRLFGIEGHRAERLRRIFEEAAQYGNRNFDAAIQEANSSADRFPSDEHVILFRDLREDVGRALLAKIQENEPLALQWEALQDIANHSIYTADWEAAGSVAMRYIDAVGIDPSSRKYWIKLYEDFFKDEDQKKKK